MEYIPIKYYFFSHIFTLFTSSLSQFWSPPTTASFDVKYQNLLKKIFALCASSHRFSDINFSNVGHEKIDQGHKILPWKISISIKIIPCILSKVNSLDVDISKTMTTCVKLAATTFNEVDIASHHCECRTTLAYIFKVKNFNTNI